MPDPTAKGEPGDIDLVDVYGDFFAESVLSKDDFLVWTLFRRNFTDADPIVYELLRVMRVKRRYETIRERLARAIEEIIRDDNQRGDGTDAVVADS